MGAKEGNNTDKPKLGRPSEFDQVVADSILEIIATSTRSLKTICSMDNMPAVSTVLRWLKDVESFRMQYAHAKECQADFMAEEMIDIADDGSNDLMTVVKGDTSYEMENKEVTNRSKLRVETRKWIASKLKPKKYGDKLDVTTDGDKINSLPQNPIINVYQTGVKLSSSEEDIDDNKPDTPTDV